MEPEEKRYPRARAMAVAEHLMANLAPHCDRIVIAGSLRRECATVGDVELLYIPHYEQRQKDFFSTEPFDTAAAFIDELVAIGVLSKRQNKNGVTSWGEKNRLAIHEVSGIPIDLFATTPENWWVSLVIRTGGKATNLKLTTGAQAKGASLMAYGCGIRLQNQQVIPATSEEHVFSLCGVPYADPRGRE